MAAAMEKKPNGGIQNYDSKITVGLGIVHIAIGVITMVFTGVFFHDDDFNGVSNGPGWGVCSVLFMASGSLGIAGGCKKSKSLIIATLVLSIVSAIAAFSLLVVSSVFVNAISGANIAVFQYYLGILQLITMMIVATFSAVLAGAGFVHQRNQPEQALSMQGVVCG